MIHDMHKNKDWYPGGKLTQVLVYYSADVFIWTAPLEEGFSLGSFPHLDQLAALIMVFDVNDIRTVNPSHNLLYLLSFLVPF